jgi:adenine-specific DNA-methyltransferase
MPRKPPKVKADLPVTRYTYGNVMEPATPETGQTALLPDEDLTVSLDMQDGWLNAIDVGRLPEDGNKPVIVDMDPGADPVLFWSGKRSRRDIPVLPLQRNEVVTASRIEQIVSRVRERGQETGTTRQIAMFAELEKSLRESDRDQRVDFYQHEEGWKNKLICGDSLQVMESLLHYEGMRGKVQMIYIDPPYGIKYDSNFQQRIDSPRNDERDRADDVLTIKAYRDTWDLGIHSYLSYLQERLYLCRDLLADTGSIFVQINIENVHLLRALLDEVLGAKQHFATIAFNKTTGFTDQRLSSVFDCLLWYAKDVERVKYRQLYQPKAIGLEGAGVYTRVELPDGTRRRLTREELKDVDSLPQGWRVYRLDNIVSQGAAKEPQPFEYKGKTYFPSANSHWKTTVKGLERLAELGRIEISGNSLAYVRYHDDFAASPISNMWLDTGTGSFTEPKVYAVQTGTKVVLRCVAMTTDPGDIVLDPTCGSGTTAISSERLGRRWVTCDTSRVAVNVARTRLLSSVFEAYKMRDQGRVEAGFVYRHVNRMTLKSAASDLEPERVDLVDQPEIEPGQLRVTGPLEVMTLGRYAPDDWNGYVTEAGKLENYITVICRLYRRDAALQASGGMIRRPWNCPRSARWSRPRPPRPGYPRPWPGHRS